MAEDFTFDDLDTVRRTLADAGRDHILPRFRRLQAADIRRKTSAFDVVTEADEEAERAITARLQSAFGGAPVIGEEATGRRPALLDLVGSAELAFIVDPLDGTRNFSCGLPLFGMIAAVVARGEVIGGVIHDPVTDSTAFALRGGGAWMQEADGSRRRLRVAPAVPLHEMEGVVGTGFLPQPLRGIVSRNLSRLGTTNWFRCAAHEYRLVADGHCHLLLYNRLMPWDHAAGWLLHREAGGFSAHFDGSPYRPAHTSGGLVCAPDEASWHAVRQGLLEP